MREEALVVEDLETQRVAARRTRERVERTAHPSRLTDGFLVVAVASFLVFFTTFRCLVISVCAATGRLTVTALLRAG
jgi:hypothetical protein